MIKFPGTVPTVQVMLQRWTTLMTIFPAQVEQLQDTLKALKESALEQEHLPFDPSGTANSADEGTGAGSLPGLTDTTTLLSLEDPTDEGGRATKPEAGSKPHLAYTIAADGSRSLSGATQQDKVEYLHDLFPTITPLTIQQTLQKCAGDIDKSMDVLLNLAFFDESQIDEDGTKISLPKGIDGFMQEDIVGSSRKKGRKKRQTKNHGNSGFESSMESLEVEPLNKWQSGQRDIEFIWTRTSAVLTKQYVTSTYHANAMSLPATIRAIAIANSPEKHSDNQKDLVTDVQVAELSHDFPSIPPSTLAGLCAVTQNIMSATSELAVKMTSQPPPPILSDLIKFTAPPIDTTSDHDQPKRRPNTPQHLVSYDEAHASATTQFAAGSQAYSQASQAYRRGGSTPLLRGAAAYYSEVGRDQFSKAKANIAAAADALVAEQSSASCIDLHGVPVQDAVRITRDRVAAWWGSLGDAKYQRGEALGARGGFRIITGVGRHSRDGTSRLGPAVSKMLVREGWRVEIGEGELTVLGVARR
ncbi:hypothetical protein N7474_002804 [Penicillium riverlandense]|uniref:uncharacterized protein n=1 Tax=Penicillium riverlandense TaxID=1903569 RepID=UPI002548262B|nr:uncharacterized protein N7474_002804 [Penicillium riverlandense]KAJ5825666.1 hypothetical protein N7474_002804 [Penicillium riverlandense]